MFVFMARAGEHAPEQRRAGLPDCAANGGLASPGDTREGFKDDPVGKVGGDFRVVVRWGNLNHVDPAYGELAGNVPDGIEKVASA